MVTRPRSSVFTDRGKERFAGVHAHSCTLACARKCAHVRSVRFTPPFVHASARLNFPRARSWLSARHDTSHALCADMHVSFARRRQVPSDEIMRLYLYIRPISFGTGSGGCWHRQINNHGNYASRVRFSAKESREKRRELQYF